MACHKYDLSGAYLNAIIGLCLDSTNILAKGDEYNKGVPVIVTDRVTEEPLTTYWVEQNSKALLPIVAKKVLDEKNKLRELKKNIDPKKAEYKIIEEKYDAVKGVALSAWGVMGNKYFRLYDKRVAAMITSIIRDLLHHTRDKLKEREYNLIYVDTDGIIVEGKEIITDWLNKIVGKWSKKKFGKKIGVEFDYEGEFTKLCIKDECHYIGYLKTEKGIKKEIKGVEAKRVSSAKEEARFQEELIDRVLEKRKSGKFVYSEDEIVDWIKERVEAFDKLSIFEVSFPTRLSKPIEDYGVKSIHIKALLNRQENDPKFKKKVGEIYYYAYVDGGNVIAFDEDNPIDRELIDYDKMIERNIYNKCRAIFRALGWENAMEKLVGKRTITRKKKPSPKTKSTLNRFVGGKK